MVRAFFGHSLAGMVFLGFLGFSASAASDQMDLVLRSTGAVTATFSIDRTQDDLHTCALLGSAGAEQTLVLTYDASQSDMLLPPSDFGFSLSIAGRVGTTWAETQPSAILQVSIGKRAFLGLHASDPAFRLAVLVEPGGAGGTFSATHLRDTTTGQTIDVTGSWRCGAADPKPTPVLVDRGPSSSTPQPAASPDPAATDADPTPGPPLPPTRSFRLFHAAPCQAAECNVWTAIDVRSGRSFATQVSLKDLRISRSLIAAAQEARIELWVTGETSTTKSGRKIVAKQLDGVTPRRGDATP
jgi:hypothetical protein